MSQPGRNASPESILGSMRVFFATTKTSMGRRLLQSERNADLLVDVLRSLVAEHRFHMYDFVIMPDHIHVLIEVSSDMTVEKAMQLIKGRFSYRLAKEFGFKGEVWQRGFSEEQVMNGQGMEKCRAYIAANPVKAGLADSALQYPYCYTFLANRKAAGAKARVDLGGLRHD
jgi:putative transposase